MSKASFVPAMGTFFRPGSRRIATGDGVLVDHYVVDEKKRSYHVTRAAKHCALAGELRLIIRSKSLAATMDPPEGLHIVRLADAEFNDAFVVWANDVERGRVWLDTDNRNALLMTSSYAFALRDGKIIAESNRLDVRARRLLHVIKAVSCFGRTAERLRRHWLSMAEPQVGDQMAEAAGIAGYRVEHEGVSVEVSHAGEQSGVLGRRGYTEMRARRRETATDRFVIRKAEVKSESEQPISLRGVRDRSLAAYEVTASQPDDAGLRFATESRVRLDLVGPTRLEAGLDWVSLRMDGTRFEPKRMDAALDLLTSLAQPSDGAS